MPAPATDARDGAQCVRRTLAVLRLVATGQEQGVRLTDIAAMSGFSRPTVHRLLKVLIEETAVVQDTASRRYLIGPELLLLGLARTGGFPIRAIAEPYLLALASEIGDTVFLSVRHGADSVCIGRYLGSHPIQVLSINLGARRPLGGSVSGIVLLAGLDEPTARDITRTNEPRLALQQRSGKEVLRLVQAARSSGHAYAAQGVMPGSAALSVPVRDGSGAVLAAISVAALGDRLGRKRLPTVLERMQACAAMITGRCEEIARARAPARHVGSGTAGSRSTRPGGKR